MITLIKFSPKKNENSNLVRNLKETYVNILSVRPVVCEPYLTQFWVSINKNNSSNYTIGGFRYTSEGE